ncbi:sulfite exporter TauE/SafE family protein 3-like [Malus domestica]|uniref:sulfite exporter TauE/SafE family protein 3-like n=1 Tax=Malus domestica TaxID=3750 RepID=UPI003976E9E0
MQSNGDDSSAEAEYKPQPGGPNNGTPTETRESKRTDTAKDYTTTCSAAYWACNLLQLSAFHIPMAFGVTILEAVKLYKGHSVIASRAESNTNWKVHQLVFCSACGIILIIAGIFGGLLGLGGGFILGPVILELGIPPQVSSATATFAMTFSASMSVVKYYLLNSLPLAALHFTAVATFSAVAGQYVVRKVVGILGRASIIIFILAFTISVLNFSGGVGIADMIEKIENKECMEFENICTYDA